MLGIVDFSVDNSDDIILEDDISLEIDVVKSTLRTVERRLVAREDDFIIDDISAGLERFLFNLKTSWTKDEILIAMNNSLQTDSLLSPYDYKILINETDDTRLHLIVKFLNGFIGGNNTFRIIVDITNQRIFRG